MEWQRWKESLGGTLLAQRASLLVMTSVLVEVVAIIRPIESRDRTTSHPANTATAYTGLSLLQVSSLVTLQNFCQRAANRTTNNPTNNPSNSGDDKVQLLVYSPSPVRCPVI